MELRAYWRIVRRRLWLVATLLALFAISYWFFGARTAPSYQASMRFVVSIVPEDGAGRYYTYDRYYTWLTAEYLVDDLSEVVKSQAFAQDVAAIAGVSLPPGAIQGATSASKLHRILNVSVHWGNQQELARIANAIPGALRERGEAYFAQLGTEDAIISLIDPPQIGEVAPPLRQRLDLPLRLILALCAGIALTFFLDYVDDSIRHRADAESLGLPILGEIPGPRCSTPWRRRRSVP